MLNIPPNSQLALESVAARRREGTSPGAVDWTFPKSCSAGTIHSMDLDSMGAAMRVVSPTEVADAVTLADLLEPVARALEAYSPGGFRRRR